MEELLMGINWIAVVVGAVLAYVLGAVWYAQKMFGKKWMEGIHLPPNHKSSMALPMIAQAGSTFLFAVVIGITQAMDNLLLGILITFTIAGFIKAGGLFAGKTLYAVLVETGFVLVMGAVLIGTHMVL